MLRQSKKLLLAVVAASALVASPAFATTFSLTGALDYGLSKTGDAATAEVKGALGYGGGVLVDFGSMKTSLEVGALYVSRGTKTTVLGVGTTTHGGGIRVPVGVRIGMSQAASVFLGGHADYALQTPMGTDFPDGTSFGDKTNFGLEAGIRLSTAMKGAGLFFEPRYYYEFGKNGASGTSNLMGLIGVTFGGR